MEYNLEWDPLEMEDGEEIRVHTFTMDEALAATREDYRCDPEAALALWLFFVKKFNRKIGSEKYFVIPSKNFEVLSSRVPIYKGCFTLRLVTCRDCEDHA